MEMNRTQYYPSLRLNNRGVTVILVAVVLLVMIGMASLAIDIGYVAVTKNEMQNATDAAALAAARVLGGIYPISYPLDEAHRAKIESTAEKIISLNIPKNRQPSKSVNIQTWQPDASVTYAPDAVKIYAQSKIEFFFAKVLGIDGRIVGADATSALPKPSVPVIPVGIASSSLGELTAYCGKEIVLYPIDTLCIGWHNFSQSSVSKDAIKTVLLDMRNKMFTTTKSIGDRIVFTGSIEETDPEEGDVFDWFRLLYQDQGYDIDANGNLISASNTDARVPKYTKDDNGNTIRDEWYNPLTTISGIDAYLHEMISNAVVYNDAGTCDNSGEYEITGYIRLRITDVFSLPDKKVVGKVICNPKLVE